MISDLQWYDLLFFFFFTVMVLKQYTLSRNCTQNCILNLNFFSRASDMWYNTLSCNAGQGILGDWAPSKPVNHCCSVAQSLSRIRLLMTPLTAARQAPLFFTISWSLLKLMSTESMMPSNHLILCHRLLLLPSIFPSIRAFPMSQLFASHGQIIGASASVLPLNIQG